MDEKVIKDLSVKISEYDYEISIYRQRWYVHMIFVLLALILCFMGGYTFLCFGSMLIAVILFMIRINKKRKLLIQKSSLLGELEQSLNTILIDDYLKLKQKIINAGR